MTNSNIFLTFLNISKLVDSVGWHKGNKQYIVDTKKVTI